MNLKSLQRTIDKIQGKPWVRIPMLIAQRFGHDNGGLFAAGLAFFMLLSFAPLILTGVAAMAFFIHDPVAIIKHVKDALDSMFPAGAAQQEIDHLVVARLNINSQADKLVRGSGVAGSIGFLTLVWTSMQIFINASSAMNAAFEVNETRSWVKLRLVSLGLLVVSGILIVVSFALSSAPAAAEAYANKHGFMPVSIPIWLLATLSELIAVSVNALLFFVIYIFLPSEKVAPRSALIAGAIISVMWEVFKKLLASFVVTANKSLYGDLAGLIVFILWIYYSMMLLLLGAEIAAVSQGKAKTAHPGGDVEERIRVGSGRRGKTFGAEMT